MSRGFFVAIEGGDGAGKSTLAASLVSSLVADGHEVVETREPGTGPVGQLIRTWLAENGHVEPRALLGLYLVDRCQHVAQVIRPALQRGAVVVCDRYRASTLAYQGGGARVFDVPTLDQLDRMLGSGGLFPDLTLLLDLPPLVSASRVRRRGGTPDHFEAQDVAWRARVRDTYVRLAGDDAGRWAIIDATKAPDAVAEQAAEVVRRQLRGRAA